jgi:hypothetical protein
MKIEAVLFVLFLGCAWATIGVDLSQECLPAGFQCLYNNGFRFAIIRAWMSTGQPDPVGPHTIYNAWSGNMSHVDAYLFPCYSCGNPTGQVSAAVANLKSYNDNYGMLWFDIEGPGTYWSGDQSANANFFQQMVNEAEALGVKLGIYTSASQWIPIMGGYTGGSAYPLWYAHYDGNPSFADFSPFGGWTRPAIKQYQGSTNICGCGVDYNWYPD